MWEEWMAANTTSPRTEVIHQVANKYTTLTPTSPYCNSSTRLPCATTPFGPAIRMGKYKLVGGHPGTDDTVVPWPAPGSKDTPFGLTSGSVEAGTDHARAGGVTGATGSVVCSPWCLYNLEVDLAEQNDLAADPTYAPVVAQLAARVAAAGASGPPWAWPLINPLEDVVQGLNCAAANRTGSYEPVLEAAPPLPPAPPPVGPAFQYWKDDVDMCLLVNTAQGMQLVMQHCNNTPAVHKITLWQQGTIRNLPTLENVELGLLNHNHTAGRCYCVHIGVNPGNMTCTACPTPIPPLLD
jgi:hypothetical protein